MMTGLAIQLFGGPLDGLHLEIPDAGLVELRFPLLIDNVPWVGPLQADAPMKTDELVYAASSDPHRFDWKSG